MKKRFILIIILFICVMNISIYSESIKDFTTKHSTTIILIVENQNLSQILTAAFYPNSDIIKFGYESIGNQTIFKKITEDEDRIYFELCYLWCGDENSTPTETRHINYYKVSILKNKIFNSIDKTKSFNITKIILDYNPLLLSIEDSENTIFNKSFCVKEITSIKKQPLENSENILTIQKDDIFSVEGITTSNLKDDIWLKIKFNQYEGYIKLSSLAENWTVIYNNL